MTHIKVLDSVKSNNFLETTVFIAQVERKHNICILAKNVLQYTVPISS